MPNHDQTELFGVDDPRFKGNQRDNTYNQPGKSGFSKYGALALAGLTGITGLFGGAAVQRFIGPQITPSEQVDYDADMTGGHIGYWGITPTYKGDLGYWKTILNTKNGFSDDPELNEKGQAILEATEKLIAVYDQSYKNNGIITREAYSASDDILVMRRELFDDLYAAIAEFQNNADNQVYEAVMLKITDGDVHTILLANLAKDIHKTVQEIKARYAFVENQGQLYGEQLEAMRMLRDDSAAFLAKFDEDVASGSHQSEQFIQDMAHKLGRLQEAGIQFGIPRHGLTTEKYPVGKPIPEDHRRVVELVIEPAM